MRKKGIVAAIGMIGVVAAVASCPTTPPTPPPPAEDLSVRKYLGENGGPNALYVWEIKVGKAICQLEERNPNGLDPAKRYCPAGTTDPPLPPKYPPPEE